MVQNKRDTEHTLDFGTCASGIQLNPQQNKDSIGSSDLGKLQTLLEEMEREKQNAGAEHDMLRSHIVSHIVSLLSRPLLLYRTAWCSDIFSLAYPEEVELKAAGAVEEERDA